MYIEPVFGSTQFAKLDPELLEKFYARLRKCKHLCDGRRSRNHVCVPLWSQLRSADPLRPDRRRPARRPMEIPHREPRRARTAARCQEDNA